MYSLYIGNGYEWHVLVLNSLRLNDQARMHVQRILSVDDGTQVGV